MRALLISLAVSAIALSAFGQRPGSKPPGPDPEDKARIPWKETERSLDEIRRRQVADAPLLESAKLIEAIKNYQPGKLPELLITWGEFMTADGTEFVALQFAPAASTYMKPNTRVVLFGQFTDEKGSPVTSFEETLAVQQSKRDTYIERSMIMLKPKLVLTVGVMTADEVIAMNRIAIDEEELSKVAPSVSRLLLSDNLYTMPAVQKPLDPFAFGGTKVVPKPDRTFRKGDELWLFTELRNPTLDPQKVPHLTTKVEIEGAGKKISTPPSPADAAPLKGVDRHFGVGQSIDTSVFAAGEYKIRYTVRDTLSNQSFVREGTFRVVD